MLKLRVQELLQERAMTTMDLSKQANIVYATALALVRGTTDRIKLETIEKVCVALNVTPGDLFEYAAPHDARRAANTSTAKPARPKRTRTRHTE